MQSRIPSRWSNLLSKENLPLMHCSSAELTQDRVVELQTMGFLITDVRINNRMFKKEDGEVALEAQLGSDSNTAIRALLR